MGLDMYAWTLNRTPEAPVDFTADDAAQLHYWRKHPNLHGWMEQRYREKGGTDRDFNCVNLQLTRDERDELEADIKAGNLPPISGFSGVSDGRQQDDLRFVAKAREALTSGLTVFYSSWW